MAYAVKQPSRGKVYVHIAENIYRPALGQSRQERRYVGTLDAAGRLTLGKNVAPPDAATVALLAKAGIDYAPERRRERRRCTCGTLLVDGRCPLCSGAVSGVDRIGVPHLFGELASGLGLGRCLAESFGKRGGDLLALAMHRAATGKALYLAEPWLAGAGVKGSFSSPAISRLLREVGADAAAREGFLSRWREAQGNPAELVCDITSISTRSPGLRLAEWGYNRDHEKLPQVNVALVSGRGADGMPLACRLIPGSVPDVSTLANTSSWLSALGFGKVGFSLDRGFHSKANVLRMVRGETGFVIGVPITSESAERLMAGQLNRLKSGRRSFLWRGRVMRHVRDEMALKDHEGGVRLPAHLYYEPARAEDMRAEFEGKLLALEIESGKAGLESRAEAFEWLREHAGRHAGMFRLVRHGMMFRVARKPNAAAAAMRFMGCTLILTDDPSLGGEAVLEVYRSRDGIEKLFDTLKNEAGQHRLRTGDDVVAEGQLFLSLLALILRRALERRMRAADLLKKHSVDALLAEIEKISRVNLLNGDHILVEVTKKQREFMQKVEVPLPQS